MWANKLRFIGNFSHFPFSVQQPSKKWNKTFNLLSTLNNNIRPKGRAQLSLEFFSKSLLKFKIPIRAQTTLYVENLHGRYRRVGYWLLGCSTMVYFTISLGGYTRLTESGLSMVTWRLAYESYPTSEEDWIREFEKYKEYPEFKQLKTDITLNEFKRIWKTEYFHRNLGRVVGLVFLVPAIAFWARGYFSPKMKKRILVFGSLIGIQGLWGWYMVKSGLEDKFHAESDIPRVSQYRLAGHLGLALTLYTGFLWSALDLLIPSKTFELANGKNLKFLTHCSKGMVFITALSGAFVAGLDAGLIYNSFPKMGGKWIPDDILAIKPIYKNFTENPTMVQFIHRILAVSTFTLCITTWAASKKYHLPKNPRLAMNLLAIVACYQVYLGYSTLLNHVPIHQAIAHQSGSVLLLSTALFASQQLKNIKYLAK